MITLCPPGKAMKHNTAAAGASAPKPRPRPDATTTDDRSGRYVASVSLVYKYLMYPYSHLLLDCEVQYGYITREAVVYR